MSATSTVVEVKASAPEEADEDLPREAATIKAFEDAVEDSDHQHLTVVLKHSVDTVIFSGGSPNANWT